MMWRPKVRNISYQDKPDGIPDHVFQEAQVAKRFYNENWEFWVWQESQYHNRSLNETEDACIRGIQKAINRMKHIYGPAIGDWYERYLDMGDIFRSVSQPTYENKLGV